MGPWHLGGVNQNSYAAALAMAIRPRGHPHPYEDPACYELRYIIRQETTPFEKFSTISACMHAIRLRGNRMGSEH